MAAIAYAPRIPLHSIGVGRRDLSGFFTHRVTAPRIPLHLAGGAQAAQTIAPIAGKVATGAASSAGWGAAAGPIGVAVAVGIGLIAGLMAAHALRAKQAKDENSAVNIGVNGFDADLKSIQQALASGQVDVATAIQGAQVALQNFWQLVGAHIQPGRNGCSSGSACPASAPANYCSGSIGAACCVGCGDLNPSVLGPNGVIAAIQGTSTAPEGPNVAHILKVFSSKYGANQRNAYTLTFTPPAAGSTTAAIEQSLAIGGSGSLLPWLLIAGAAFLVMR